MLLLALDTSTSAVTAALHDGVRLLAESSTVDPVAHGERLAPEIAAVLDRAGAQAGDLTDVVCGLGPGPFTGLRVGIVTARVIALATGATLRGVCSLDALALAAARATGASELLVATDARRKEVYWARYAARPAAVAGAAPEVRALTEPAVAKPATLAEQVRALPTAGRGPVLYPEVFPCPTTVLDVSAADLAMLAVTRLAAGDPLTVGEPLYLRRPDAAPNVVAKSALG
ncbi:MAG TPA: tRNA (adenosine(37)-N6)-threonylcarbamoyltransferase complex dimerization subunit type 1 TsaB [Dermatophilaceae bacterium]|nr:tRNA (adenosine(37)-N6)-threonylcarbamoyltransferase complex dimerization subunit type 1 TsaB [Dermatophilaceae bacterium]